MTSPNLMHLTVRSLPTASRLYSILQVTLFVASYSCTYRSSLMCYMCPLEFMEHDVEALPISLSILAELAQVYA